MKKTLAIFLLICLFVLSMTACGDSGSPSSTDSKGGASGNNSVSENSDNSNNKDSLWNKRFDGVKLKRIVWYTVSDDEKKMIQEFEEKTGATIEDVVVDFANINTKLAQSMSSGDIIDIGWMEGGFFPTQVIANMYLPVDEYIGADYLVDTSTSDGIAAGGFDMEKMSYYKWNNHYYGLCSYWDVDLPVLYYRKDLFIESGMMTPLERINTGSWNLDTFYEDARQLTNAKTGMAGYSAGGQNSFGMLEMFIESYGVQIVKTDSNGNPTQNLGDSKMLDALNFIQKMYNGAGAVLTSDASFYNGKAAMCIDGLYMIPKLLTDPTVPDVVKNNWELAPIPLAIGNEDGSYPTGWLKATGIVRGTEHPDAVAAYALYKSKYRTDNLYEQYLSEDQKSLIEPLYNSVIYPNYSYGDMGTLLYNMLSSITNGGDITQLISENKTAFQAQIDKVLKE